jgi:hypothetical protein
LTRV